MNKWQQWGYRLFFVTTTTALAFALGWLGSVAANYYTQTLQRLYFQGKLSAHPFYERRVIGGGKAIGKGFFVGGK